VHIIIFLNFTWLKNCNLYLEQEFSRLRIANRGPITNVATPTVYFRYCFRNVYRNNGTAD